MKIAVVAPSCTLKREAAAAVEAIVAARGDCVLAIHPQCFLSDGHFAGTDEARLAALREAMADPAFDAVWFARGGYGSNRIAEAALASLPEAARAKFYMGYSDAGFLLAGMHKAGLDVAQVRLASGVFAAPDGSRIGSYADLSGIVDLHVQVGDPSLDVEL